MVWDVTVIGSGPAGLGAAIEASKRGINVLLVDENEAPGGQLFKQIHKFFGSREHFSGKRGYQIGEMLLEEALSLGVTFSNMTRCEGVTDEEKLILHREGGVEFVTSKRIILATGGIEKGLPFKGWTLPGVMTAGCAQTFANVRGIRVGNKGIMIGSGNVGLITSYQMMQAGMEMKGICEVMDHIGGYQVHLGKVMKRGVPLYLGHEIMEAFGDGQVEGCILKDRTTGEKKAIKVDTIMLAVGLRTNSRLANILGCPLTYSPSFGGLIPYHDRYMETPKKHVYVAGDISGIEEANTALDEGRLAGLSAAASLGKMVPGEEFNKLWKRLGLLRSGPFGEKRQAFKDGLMKGGGISGE